MTIFNIFIALSMGAILAIYVPMISKSAQILGSGALANIPFFAIALVSSVLIAIGNGSRLGDLSKVTSVPPVLFLSGVMSACMIIGTSFLVPKIGIGALFVCLVSGQVLVGMFLGQLGLFGAPKVDMSVLKFLGALMVVAGVYLTTFK